MYLLVQDVTAGRCLQDAGQNGRDFTAAEKAAFTQCGFNSMEGFELNEHLECTVRPSCSSGLYIHMACCLRFLQSKAGQSLSRVSQKRTNLRVPGKV